MLGELRIHISPVGNDDPKRIIIPIITHKADRVYLITKSGKDVFKDVVEEVKTTLLRKTKLNKEDIQIIKTNIYDFHEIQASIAEIFRKEVNNEIFYNVSTGGKLLSIGGYLSCLLFGGKTYYCKKDYEKKKILDNPEILIIPEYYIERPDEELIEFLIFLESIEEKFDKKKVTKRAALEIMKIIKKENITGVSGDYNKLNSRFLEKLSKLGYIREYDDRPKKIKIKKQGFNTIKVFDAYYNIKNQSEFELKKAKLENSIMELIK